MPIVAGINPGNTSEAITIQLSSKPAKEETARSFDATQAAAPPVSSLQPETNSKQTSQLEIVDSEKRKIQPLPPTRPVSPPSIQPFVSHTPSPATNSESNVENRIKHLVQDRESELDMVSRNQNPIREKGQKTTGPEEEAADARQTGEGKEAVGDYWAAVATKLGRYQRYPRLARKRRIEGRIVVLLTLGSDGQVIRYQITEGAEIKLLKQAVIRMINNAGRFPPFPENIRKDEMSRHIPVNFTLGSK